MTNVELLKAIHDALVAAATVMENRLSNCDAREPDTAFPAHDLHELYRCGALSARASNCLGRAGFDTMEQVVDRVENLKGLQRIRNMGPHSVAEVLKVAHDLGLKWKWEWEDYHGTAEE